jgi:hypothetical protein
LPQHLPVSLGALSCFDGKAEELGHAWAKQ